MLINHASKQVTAKIVYYGAGLSGKTTNLQYIFSVTHPRSRGELVSMETEIERTIFFDLLPMNVGTIKGYTTKFQLYTVPGQVFYDSTRKLVLRGADGVVFVVDSQELMRKPNLQSLENLRENIAFYGGQLEDLPLVFQFNKRDLKNIMSVPEINGEINLIERPYSEAVAKTGVGVIETLRKISNLTLIKIRQTLEQVEGSSARAGVTFDMHTPTGPEKAEVEAMPFRRITFEEPAAMQPQGPLLTDLAARMDTERKAEREIEKPMGIPDDGVIHRTEKVALREPQIRVEIKNKSGDLLKTFVIDTPKESRKVDIVLDLER